MAKKNCKFDEENELRRGPWTLEEDTLLVHYIGCHGEGRWNLLARCSGLKRTGKSCRLRWLNYLKPDVKRGNLTPEEQLLILELHSKWGNRWSRIAQHLPGRTDNEIKNYWRTRVQKQARQLKCDANSTRFRDTIRYFWMPKLLQKMDISSFSSPIDPLIHNALHGSPESLRTNVPQHNSTTNSENCSNCISTDSMKNTQFPEISEFPASPPHGFGNFVYNPLLRGYYVDINDYEQEALNLNSNPILGSNGSVSDKSMVDVNWVDEWSDNLWNMDELWRQNGI